MKEFWHGTGQRTRWEPPRKPSLSAVSWRQSVRTGIVLTLPVPWTTAASGSGHLSARQTRFHWRRRR